jgi:hypothetical protein
MGYVVIQHQFGANDSGGEGFPEENPHSCCGVVSPKEIISRHHTVAGLFSSIW